MEAAGEAVKGRDGERVGRGFFSFSFRLGWLARGIYVLLHRIDDGQLEFLLVENGIECRKSSHFLLAGISRVSSTQALLPWMCAAICRLGDCVGFLVYVCGRVFSSLHFDADDCLDGVSSIVPF